MCSLDMWRNFLGEAVKCSSKLFEIKKWLRDKIPPDKIPPKMFSDETSSWGRCVSTPPAQPITYTENKISWIQVNLFTRVYLLLLYIIYT